MILDHKATPAFSPLPKIAHRTISKLSARFETCFALRNEVE